jgi:hypothetical protein
MPEELKSLLTLLALIFGSVLAFVVVLLCWVRHEIGGQE